ncbi:MAG TPA: septation protein A [Caulobacterales bacterium]|jgi:intracellular septation protein|nr:septation protein A [Caulobacterales bacterium]
MSDPALTAETPKPKKRGAHEILIDFGPVAVFMVSYNLIHRARPDEAIFYATGLFMAATLAALAYSFFVQKRVPPMLLITAVVVGVFGGLTIWLHNPVFVKMKPTVINLLFAAAIFGGLLFKQNVLKILLQATFDLPERIWTIFAVRYGFFFIFLAGLNEFIWRTFSESFWVNFKLIGVLTITILFGLAQIPLIGKHMKEKDAGQ